jgi:high affinity sulfate transporter 1
MHRSVGWASVATARRPGIPGLQVIRTYQRAWLSKDIVAGLVLTAVLVPVGMGYAEAAGLPAITGLYATVVPLAVYAVLGPSRILVLGPDSALAAVIAVTILPLAGGDPARAVALAGGLALISGAFGIGFGLLHLGLLTDLLSKPIRIGYLNGIALTVLVGQLPKLFGFSVDGDGFIDDARGFLEGVVGGETNPASLAIGLLALSIVIVGRWRRAGAAGIVVATVLTSVIAGLLGLGAAGVALVGPLPAGLPSVSLPAVSLADLVALLAGGLAIAVVSLADTSVLSRTFALRAGTRVDQDQELLALGAANVGSALFGGFPISASTSRTPVAEAAGGKTQLTGLIGAVAIVGLLILAPWLTTNLPQPTLAAIVIVASTALVDMDGLIRLWRLRPSEFLLSVACFLGVVLVGVVAGIFIAIGLALAAFFWRAWRPYSAILGRVDGLKGYHDVSRYPHARRPEGLVLFRWDAPLFFANAEDFRERVEEAVREAGEPTRWVVVAAEPVTDIDMTAADMLADLLTVLEAGGTRLLFAELKDPVKDRLRRYGLLERIGDDAFFPTVGTAVSAYVAETGVAWVDWEERAPDG